MPRPKATPNSYRDVAPYLEAALQNGGSRHLCTSQAAAVRLVQRMNQYRLMTRRMNHEMHKQAGPKHNETPEQWAFDVQSMKWHISQFDELVIRYPVDGWIIIERKPDRPILESYDLNGNPIEVRDPDDNPLDPNTFDRDILRKQQEYRDKGIIKDPSAPPREKFNPNKPLGLLDE